MIDLKRYLPLLLIAIIAIAFRFPLLDSLPPGLNFDEGGEGVAALDVANGQFRIWWPIGGGKEPLMAYLVQPLFWLFGPTRLALRLYAALMGVGAVLATYFLARQLFYVKKEDDPALYLLPVFAALGLATAFWHVAYSRIAFRALSNPMVEALALGFLWMAFRTGRRRHFLLAGFFTGSLIYTYLAGRFVPIAIALFFAAEALIAWRQKRQSLLALYRQKLAAMVAAAIVVFLPAAIFFIQNPGDFAERAGSVSIFSPAMNQGNFWGSLWRTTATTLGTFLSLTGDPNPLGNIPGKPELSPLLAIFFVVGVVTALFGVRSSEFRVRSSGFRVQGSGFRVQGSGFKKPKTQNSELKTRNSKLGTQNLFLLIWWPVMLLPAILAPEGAPHHLRLIGTAPATYILAGLGFAQVSRWVGERVGRYAGERVGRYAGGQVSGEAEPVLGLPKDEQGSGGEKSHLPTRSPAYLLVTGWVLLFLIFGFTARQTYRDYFITWADEVEHYMPFDVYAEELALLMAAESDPSLAYAIPMDLRAAHEARHYSLDFLYRGETPFSYIVVDDVTVANSLTGAAQGKRALKVVRWTQDKHREADTREVVTFLLATGGAEQVGSESYPVYTIETYQLPAANTQFALPAIETPVDAALDGLIQVRRAVVLPELTPGGEVAAGITYAPIAPIDADYKASLRLVGPDGQTVAQKDRLLQHNWHQPTSLWPREEVNEYYLIPLPPNLQPGVYEVRLVVYHPDTLAPLTDGGQVEVVLGRVDIVGKE